MKKILYQWFFSLYQYLRISLFLSSPAHLLYSPASLILTLLSYIVAGYIALGTNRSLLPITAQIALEISLLAAISWLFLKLNKKPQRLLQTVSALAGVSLVITVVGLIATSFFPHNLASGKIDPLLLKIDLLLLLWDLAAVSLIFKRSFDITTILAAFAALSYFLFYEYLLINFF